ncbi:complex I subunit 1/NuoH family protein [Ktedonospora formicarum]|uniref:NADH-quinone oxidoreductase subunit H n=1 Tax=Ktedonospora formicarum TaxID=2778364 RepID=A0A8J3I3D9_9CHLR|nr:complex I subunit 1 family protein [Ktedonospora formicarum]GHO44734.1 NADH-quinone oxidoreductase subunit H [Ktedonospora formicarum]
MYTVILADGDLWGQLLRGILSWETLQFVVAFLSIFGFVLTSATLLVLIERKVIAWAQDRFGPYHTGPWGLLQSVADVAKLLLKEDVHTAESDKLLFWMAPSVFLAPMIATFAVIPISPYLSLPGTALATGIIYYVAMSSIDVVGVVMAGWSSNNKYALMGGLRGAAQMISYELPLVLSLLGVVILTSVLAGTHGYPGVPGIGTISLREVQDFQSVWAKTGNPVLDFIFEGFTPWAWFILVQPLMLIIYYTCGLAETNRPPFDLPEAESELVAGHMTEYSGMRWAMFFLGEYGNMTVVSAITAYMFMGGYSGPGVAYLTGLNNIWWGLAGNILALTYFVLKVYLLCFVFIWVRATLPRLRSDQLMQFAWLILIPVTLTNIIVTAGLYLIFQNLPPLVYLIVLGAINWLSVWGFIKLVGRVTTSTTRRAQAPAIRAQRRATALPGLKLRDGVPAPAPQLPAGAGSQK